MAGFDRWYELSRGYVVSFGRRRRKHGRDLPPRFIVLAPAKRPNEMRPTLCAGDVVRARCVIDTGVADERVLAELNELVPQWCREVGVVV